MGSIERFLSILIEHTAGSFPLWLSPVQVKVLPISDNQNEYAEAVASKLRITNYELRIEIDTRSESIGKKIREAAKERVPYMVIVGAKEQESNTVSVRGRGDQDLGSMSVEELSKKLQNEIDNKI